MKCRPEACLLKKYLLKSIGFSETAFEFKVKASPVSAKLWIKNTLCKYISTSYLKAVNANKFYVLSCMATIAVCCVTPLCAL